MVIATCGADGLCSPSARGRSVLRSSDAGPIGGLRLFTEDVGLVSGNCEAMRMLERTIERIAPTSLPILLVGECGTGKAYLAQRIHQLSSRQNKPIVKAICSTLTPKGIDVYFGGSGRRGTDEPSEGGTLFLKGINELDSASQRSLLYAMPEGDGPAGAEASGPRLISSTTVDLEQEVSAGQFRGDLYYRLKGACLHVPALRERKEDLPALCEQLLNKHAALQDRPRPNLDREDLLRLQEWHWPGNIRELENTIKQMVILNDAKSVLMDLAASTKELHRASSNGHAGHGPALKAATRAASRRVEEQLILDALAKTRWNRKRAAQDLQISYKSLLSKLKQIGGKKPEKA
jgi:two-component system, NtrC family, response regulator AtoC